MALEKEQETYIKKLPELEQHQGKFVLIHQEDVEGIFDSYADALTEGYKRFQLDPFLVKLIEGAERVHFVTRMVAAG